MIYFLSGAALLFLLILAMLFLQVQDWSRDFTTNTASTSSQAKNPALHPITTELTPADLAAIVKQAAAEIARWEFRGEESQADRLVLRYVRTTPLLRFRDDITMAIKPTATGSLLTAESKSRIGKGDLGQNPRNLAEILNAVRRRLPPESHYH